MCETSLGREEETSWSIERREPFVRLEIRGHWIVFLQTVKRQKKSKWISSEDRKWKNIMLEDRLLTNDFLLLFFVPISALKSSNTFRNYIIIQVPYRFIGFSHAVFLFRSYHPLTLQVRRIFSIPTHTCNVVAFHEPHRANTVFTSYHRAHSSVPRVATRSQNYVRTLL